MTLPKILARETRRGTFARDCFMELRMQPPFMQRIDEPEI